MAGIGFPIGGQPGDDDWAAKAPLFAEIEKLMSWSGGPVNWDLARQMAVRTAAEGDAPASAADTQAVADAMRLADLWLGEATALPSALSGAAAGWSRVQWVESTLPVWQQLIDPVAARVVDGMGGALRSGLGDLAEHGLPPGLADQLPPGVAEMLPSDPGALGAMLTPMLGMLGQIGGVLFGTQVGQALGALAGHVVAAGEIGLPLAPPGQAALLPANVAAFAAGQGVDIDEVRLFLALREAAALRLFTHVPWLRPALLGAVEEYARGISVDPEQLQRSVGQLGSFDPTDPEAMQRALGEDLFARADTPEQQRALARLEALLALVEGWVDTVVDAAAAPRLPGAAALREAVRRRRVAGGPAEQTFAALVGLELRPRRLSEAATVWSGLTAARGVDGRDALWAHPDLLPHAEDLDDPTAFVVRDDVVGDDPVAAIEALMATGQRGPVEDDRGGVREREGTAEPPSTTDNESDEPDDPGEEGSPA
ncbi:MAG TPA: zinc-dependent metalloprotease [Mycobacteriales bacterium]